MCYDDDARPPIAPIAGGAVSSRNVTLTIPDGTAYAGYAARADRSGGPGVVILPDVRGLHPFYVELAERFAEHDIHSVAIDYYAKSVRDELHNEDIDWRSLARETTAESIAATVSSAVDYLRSAEGGNAEAVFTVGFCFGGAQSFLQATHDFGLGGVIGFYGPPAREGLNGSPAPLDRAGWFKCPVLGLFGGADQSIPVDDVQQFDSALDLAGVLHEIVIYPGAPHSFFDRRATEYADASADAWDRILTFIRTHPGYTLPAEERTSR